MSLPLKESFCHLVSSGGTKWQKDTLCLNRVLLGTQVNEMNETIFLIFKIGIELAGPFLMVYITQP